MFIRDRKGRPPLDGEGDDPENTRKLKQLISSSKLRVTTYQNAEQLPQFVISVGTDLIASHALIPFAH